MRSSERPRALGAPQSRKRQARVQRVAALAVSLRFGCSGATGRVMSGSRAHGFPSGRTRRWHRRRLERSRWCGERSGRNLLPYQISDSFNGTSLNSNLWFTDEQSAGTTQGVEGGALQLTASADAASGFHDGILTHCQAVGESSPKPASRC